MTKTGLSASLGAGSYDYDELVAATDAVVSGTFDDPNAAMAQAVAGIDRSNAKAIDPRETPGYRFHTRERKLGDGIVVKERIQVPISEGTEPGGDEESEGERPSRRRTAAKQAEPQTGGEQQGEAGTEPGSEIKE